MRCIWCNKGTGKNHTKSKNGKIHYYICIDCVRPYIAEQDKHAKSLLKEKELSKDG